MDNCEQYKKILKDRISGIMMNGLSDINSLEEICKLIDTLCKIDKYAKWEDDGMSPVEYPDDNSYEHEHQDNMEKHYREYMKYKDQYKTSGELEHKMKMLEHLEKVIECMSKMFENIVNKSFDCQEERMVIKDFLQRTYRIVS